MNVLIGAVWLHLEVCNDKSNANQRTMRKKRKVISMHKFTTIEQNATIEDNLLVTQEVIQRVEKLFLLGRTRIVRLQCHHNIGPRLFRVGTVGFVSRDLMHRATPLASNTGEFTLRRAFFALIVLMVLNRLVRELIATVLALTGQLGNGLLDGQIPR